MEADTTAPSGFKVKVDFISDYLEKENAEAKDLAKAFTLLDAEKIIQTIEQYDYDKNLADDRKKTLRRKFAWDRGKGKVEGKHVAEDGDYEVPTAELSDFKKFLGQLTTGEKSESSITRPADEIPQKNEENGNQSWLRPDNWQVWAVFLGMPLLIGGFLAFMFWEQIANWWNGPMEEGSIDGEEGEQVEEDDEK